MDSNIYNSPVRTMHNVINSDAVAVEAFANTMHVPTILSHVGCSGSENKMESCTRETVNFQCEAVAGLTCGTSSSEYNSRKIFNIMSPTTHILYYEQT